MNEMKKMIRIAAIAAVTLMLGACEKQQDWGIKLVYMPQAAMYNGGLTNEYPVPMPNASTPNYRLSEDNIMTIPLGVYRSGLGDLEAFSVKVSADAEATTQALTSVSRAVALPDDCYTLPETAEIADGERESIFYLTVDIRKIIDEHPEFNKNKMVLAVTISDPSKYELNENLNTTIVSIEGSEFLPVVPIVKNGGFDDESGWTIQNINNKDCELMRIEDGFLKISIDDYSSIGGDSRWACWQKLESEDLVVGNSYKVTAMVSITPQNFVNPLEASAAREMDIAVAIMPNDTDMTSQSDYKPGDDRFWYLDTNMDSGKSNYPLIDGTAGIVDFSTFNTNQRPATMNDGEFTMEEDHIGGYLCVYIRLRNACPDVQLIQFDSIEINAL